MCLISAGVPVYKLDRTSMGCGPGLPVWVAVLVSMIAVTFIVLAIILSRKWEAIKFYLFMKFNFLTNDDEPCDPDDTPFDALIAYRYVLLIPHSSNKQTFCAQTIGMPSKVKRTPNYICSHKDRLFMKKHIQVFLEEDLGFMCCIHERDFLAGETIIANVEAAIDHSRRMIFIISRSVGQIRVSVSPFAEESQNNTSKLALLSDLEQSLSSRHKEQLSLAPPGIL